MSRVIKEFKKGIIAENPVLRLCLGTCPTLAISTAALNGLGMGAAATIVLICSNIAISLLRKVIPDKVRIPAFITIIAGFVTIVQMLVKAFLPAVNDALGIYLPLIVVNCIILARAEAFASKNSVLISAVDGLGMGVGFTAALVAMGAIRELLGAGTIFGISVTAGVIPPMLIFILPPGGFFVFGMLVSLANRLAEKRGKAPATLGCENCPSAAFCTNKEQACAMNAPEEASGEHFKPSQSDDKAGEKGISGNKTADNDTDSDKDANKDTVGNDGKTSNPQKSVAADNAAEKADGTDIKNKEESEENRK